MAGGVTPALDANLVRRYPISARVNIAANDEPECCALVDVPAAPATARSTDTNHLCRTRKIAGPAYQGLPSVSGPPSNPGEISGCNIRSMPHMEFPGPPESNPSGPPHFPEDFE